MSRFVAIVLVIFIALANGCAKPPSFQFNVVAKKKAENGQPFSDEQVQDVANLLTAMFGTPDNPAFPNMKSFHWFLEYVEEEFYSDDLVRLVKFENLQQAAGPVSSDRTGRSRGLYREHCAHCHGISGDGAGPTALTLDPYPRDFRNGIYKFKSTTGKGRPSDHDLERILDEGIPGTAMPSFKVALSQAEKEALIDYVKYLSIRGEIEQALWQLTADLEKGERLPLVFANGYDENNSEQVEELEYWFEDSGRRIESVFRSWISAKLDPSIDEPEAPPENFYPSHPEYLSTVDAGRKMFHGKLGACIQCHGVTGYGDGEFGNYDIWNEWAKGKTDEVVKEYVQAGVLPPRTIRPRNFRNGVFRGGRRPVDLFYRIKNGIQGAQMPGAATLTDEQVWQIVAYVRSLKSEAITGGHSPKPVNEKPIN